MVEERCHGVMKFQRERESRDIQEGAGGNVEYRAVKGHMEGMKEP